MPYMWFLFVRPRVCIRLGENDCQQFFVTNTLNPSLQWQTVSYSVSANNFTYLSETYGDWFGDGKFDKGNISTVNYFIEIPNEGT